MQAQKQNKDSNEKFCDFCNKSFKLSTFYLHLQNVHSDIKNQYYFNNKTFECPTCLNFYKSSDSLRKHVKKCQGKNQIQECFDQNQESDQSQIIGKRSNLKKNYQQIENKQVGQNETKRTKLSQEKVVHNSDRKTHSFNNVAVVEEVKVSQKESNGVKNISNEDIEMKEVLGNSLKEQQNKQKSSPQKQQQQQLLQKQHSAANEMNINDSVNQSELAARVHNLHSDEYFNNEDEYNNNKTLSEEFDSDQENEREQEEIIQDSADFPKQMQQKSSCSQSNNTEGNIQNQGGQINNEQEHIQGVESASNIQKLQVGNKAENNNNENKAKAIYEKIIGGVKYIIPVGYELKPIVEIAHKQLQTSPQGDSPQHNNKSTEKEIQKPNITNTNAEPQQKMRQPQFVKPILESKQTNIEVISIYSNQSSPIKKNSFDSQLKQSAMAELSKKRLQQIHSQTTVKMKMEQFQPMFKDIENVSNLQANNIHDLQKKQHQIQKSPNNRTRSSYQSSINSEVADREVSIGYAEITQGSLSKVLEIMQSVEARNLKATYIDIGSGFGAATLQMAIETGVDCHGIEICSTRYKHSQQILQKFKSSPDFKNQSTLTEILNSVRFFNKDIGDLKCMDLQIENNPCYYTHIYCFDKVFTNQSRQQLIAAINNSVWVEVLAWTTNEDQTFKTFKLKRDEFELFQTQDRAATKTANQQFKFYFYRRKLNESNIVSKFLKLTPQSQKIQSKSDNFWSEKKNTKSNFNPFNLKTFPVENNNKRTKKAILKQKINQNANIDSKEQGQLFTLLNASFGENKFKGNVRESQNQQQQQTNTPLPDDSNLKFGQIEYEYNLNLKKQFQQEDKKYFNQIEDLKTEMRQYRYFEEIYLAQIKNKYEKLQDEKARQIIYQRNENKFSNKQIDIFIDSDYLSIVKSWHQNKSTASQFDRKIKAFNDAKDKLFGKSVGEFENAKWKVDILLPILKQHFKEKLFTNFQFKSRGLSTLCFKCFQKANQQQKSEVIMVMKLPLSESITNIAKESECLTILHQKDNDAAQKFIVKQLGEYDFLGIYVITVECYENTLETFITNNKLTAKQVKLISYGILSALDYAHSNYQTHGLLNPGNIYLDANLLPKVGDWGHDRGTLESKYGFYHAPELHIKQKLKIYNPYKLDSWAAGLVLYRLSHKGGFPIKADLMRIAIRDNLTLKFPKEITNPKNPLDEIISRLLQVEPRERALISDVIKSDYFQDVEKILEETLNKQKKK